MSDQHDTGGAAFPRPDVYHPITGEPISEGTYGMSLRDWFAGQMMVAMLTATAGADYNDWTAKRAYEIADAMLAERAKR